jgi:TolB-like protein
MRSSAATFASRRILALGMLGAVSLLLGSAVPVSAQKNLQAGIQNLSQQIVETMGQQEKRRLAIADFSKLDGSTDNFARYLSERLIASMFLTKRFEVMERRQLDRLLQELKLNLSDLFDPATAKRLGGLQGVDILATGSLTDMSTIVEVNARLIETGTGRVLAVATTQIAKDGDVLTLMGRSSAPAATSPAPTTVTLAGTWRGMYFYPRQNMRPVDFTVTVRGSAERFFGRMWEPATFGNGTSDKLFADIRGHATPSGDISFTKKYDGTAGVSHSVTYEGSLDEKGQTVEGRWAIGPTWSGVFRMTKQ